MPEKNFKFWLDGESFAFVEFVTTNGKVTRFVVRLIHIVDGKPVDVLRYDTAHGKPHRDLLKRNGELLEKEWFEDTDLDAALTMAIKEIKVQYDQRIKDFFRQGLPGNFHQD